MYEDMSRDKFINKLMNLKNSLIKVQLVDGSIIIGKLVGIDPDYLNMILEEPAKEEGSTQENILIPGSSISYVKWVKTVKRRENLEKNVLSLLQREPNLTKEELARILNTDVNNVEKVIRSLKRKGLINYPSDKR
ncbi:MAG: winged helix-turn-helix transcriptional regulator [Candidatus Methanomethylicia archaeon]